MKYLDSYNSKLYKLEAGRDETSLYFKSSIVLSGYFISKGHQ